MPVIWFLPTYFLIISFAPGGTSEGLASWTGNSSFFPYFMTGMLVSYVISAVFWGIGLSLKRLMDIGMFETIWTCPVPKITYIIGESLFSIIRLIFELGILYLVFRFVFGFYLPAGMAEVIPFFIPFIFMMYGFGILFASLVMLVKDANMLTDTSSFIVTTLAGTQNPPQVFPRFILTLSLAIPITYFIDYTRVRTMGIVPLVPVWIEVLVIIGAAVIFPGAGIWAFKRVDRRCRIKGNLQAH
jgi:ABC-2 type transport system permease protein